MRSVAPRVAAVVAVALAGSCGRGAATNVDADAGAGGQPAGWDREVAIAPAVDLNPDPHVLEVNLEAAISVREIVAGTTTPVWSYNGQVPGPTLRATVGDRVIVHFTNHLPESTTIHWHGIRLDAAMDGTPLVQPAVEPGATFDYQFVVPDAGLYWYHPHVRSNVQLGDGLYGAIVVDAPADDPIDTRDLGDDLLLVLSDMALESDGSFPPPNASDALAAIWGREGNVLLASGKAGATVQARRGRRQRWHLLNAATSRFFLIDMAGQTFTRIGGDRGLIQRPVAGDTLLLAPGQRADVVVVPDAPVGTTLPVRWLAYDRGFGTAVNRPPADIFKVKITADADGTTPPPLPDTLQAIEPLDLSDTTPQDLTLAPVGGGYGINGVQFGSDMQQPLHATVGGTDIWTVSNQSDFDHPFHLHGFFFQVLENLTLEPKQPLEWRDTVNVPQWTDVTFAVKYDDRPGTWMFHCHVLDHAEVGMMGMLQVAR